MSTTSGRELGGAAQRLVAVARLADHLDVVAHAQQRGQRLAEQRLVVDEQHPHRARLTRAPRCQRAAPARARDSMLSRRRGARPARAAPARPKPGGRGRRPATRAPSSRTSSADGGRRRSRAPARRRVARRACGRWSAPPAPPGTAPPASSSGSGRAGADDRRAGSARPPPRSPRRAPAAPRAAAATARGSRSAPHRPAHLGQRLLGLVLRLGEHRVGPAESVGSTARAALTCICTTVSECPSPSWMSRATRLRSCAVASRSACSGVLAQLLVGRGQLPAGLLLAHAAAR